MSDFHLHVTNMSLPAENKMDEMHSAAIGYENTLILVQVGASVQTTVKANQLHSPRGFMIFECLNQHSNWLWVPWRRLLQFPHWFPVFTTESRGPWVKMQWCRQKLPSHWSQIQELLMLPSKCLTPCHICMINCAQWFCMLSKQQSSYDV